jgi:hypothetical protein
MMIQQPLVPMFQQSQLHSLLQMFDIDEADMITIIDNSNGIPMQHRNRASQVAGTSQFRDWMVAATSRELLVCTEHGIDAGQAAASLSLLYATLVRALRIRQYHIGTVFFCGMHVSQDDENKNIGADALIRSLIVQILRYHVFDTTQLPWEVDLGRVAAGDLRELCGLFSWLVKRLPREVALVCLVDGISYYDCDEHEGDMLVVLDCLLGLVREQGLSATLKFMATSEEATESMQGLFRNDDECLLEMEGLPWVNEEACWLGDLDIDENDGDGEEKWVDSKPVQ